MANHVKTLGWLHIVFGVLGICAGLVLFSVFAGIAGFVGAQGDSDAARAVPFIAVIGVIVMIFLLVLSIPGIIAGFGLLQFKPWARILTIVLSAIELLHFPFGTALGVYGLWVLLSTEGAALFEQHRIAQAGAPQSYLR